MERVLPGAAPERACHFGRDIFLEPARFFFLPVDWRAFLFSGLTRFIQNKELK
jgi:hypothetical protein